MAMGMGMGYPSVSLRGRDRDKGRNSVPDGTTGGGYAYSYPRQLGGHLDDGADAPEAQRDEDEDNSHRDRDVLSKLVLARMQGLEESFREVLREVRGLKYRDAPRTPPATATGARPTVLRRKSERDAVAVVPLAREEERKKKKRTWPMRSESES